MNKEQFINELKKINIVLNNEQLNQIKIYKEFLKEYNKHTNLTRIVDDEDIYLKHFYDSLTVCKYIDFSSYKNLLDIGTGAGFPGMVLKIVFPKLNVTLLDSNNKKITFLKELSTKLNIEVDLIQERSEKYIINHREFFDIVISRAVASLPTLLELSIPFVKKNGYFIAMKGNAKEELLLSKNTHEILGAKIESINELTLNGALRNIILYKKIACTKTIYPREYNKIIKKPL